MVLYGINHPGNIIKSIIHKFKYHKDEKAVFLIDTDTESLLCPKIENIDYYNATDIYETVTCQDMQEIKEKVINYYDNLFKKINLDPVNFSERYAIFDMFSPVSLYFELKELDYMCIECQDNELNYFQFDYFINNHAKSQDTFFALAKELHFQDGLGKHCIKNYLFTEKSEPPKYATAHYEVFDYYKSIVSLNEKYKNMLIQVFQPDRFSFKSLLVFNSTGLVCNWLNKTNISFPKRLKNNIEKFSYFYNCIIDYYFADEDFAIKFHPLNEEQIKRNFSQYTHIPGDIPLEIFMLSDRKFKILCPLISTGLRGFEGNLVCFGYGIFEFFKSIHYIFVALKMFNFLDCTAKKIFFYGINGRELKYLVDRLSSDFTQNTYTQLTAENIREAEYIIVNDVDDKFFDIIQNSDKNCIVAVNNINVRSDGFEKQVMSYSVIDETNIDSVQKSNWCVISKNRENVVRLQPFQASYRLKNSEIMIIASTESGSALSDNKMSASDIRQDQATDADYRNKVNTLQCYYQAERKGYTLRTFFDNVGWLNPDIKVAFYAVDEFGAMVYRICEQCGLRFSAYISDKNREITCRTHENEIVSLKCCDIRSVDKSQYANIFAAITWDQRQGDFLNKVEKKWLFLFDAITESLYTRAFYLDRIQKIAQKNPQTKVAVFDTPIIKELKGQLSETESYFKNRRWINGAVCAVPNENLREKFKKSIYKDYGFDDEYINEVCWAPYPIIEKNGVRLIQDHTGKYSNVINHRRLTTDNPENYKNTVYFFGDSCVTGLNVGDRETIESAFQRILNKNNLPYLVQNCANSCGHRYNYIFSLTDTMRFKAGDILLFCSKLDWLTGLFLSNNDQNILKGMPGIHTHSLFIRPHRYGEVFSDCQHLNSKGNELVAEKIFADLQAANYFSDDFVNTSISCAETDALPTDKESDYITTRYSLELNKYLDSIKQYRPKIGSIVMNCNPFTSGHRYLIEYAASQVEKLYIFVVEEDKSIFPFADRMELVKKGTADLEKVVVLPSGKFMISSLTFQQYFDKGELQNEVIDASGDVEIFAKEIAPAMGITVRFAGEEPLDNVTRQYNASMKNILPQYGIEFVEIPRKEEGNGVISASRVRKLLETDDFDSIAKLVPNTTLEYLKKGKENFMEINNEQCPESSKSLTRCLVCTNMILQSSKERLGFIKYYENCGEFKITGIASYDIIYKKVFGYDFVNFDKLNSELYDIAIIMENELQSDIRNKLISMGFSDKPIIPYYTLTFDGFGISNCRRLLSEQPSIFAINCWGGILSHCFGLSFNSPLVNMFMSENDYLKFVENPRYYIDQPLAFHSTAYEENLKFDYPIAQCGDILLNFNHYKSFDEAQQFWERRKARINWENLIVMMYTENYESAERFSKLPYKKKICFTTFDYESDSTLCVKYYQKLQARHKLPFYDIVLSIARGHFQYIDLFDLLLNGKITKTISLPDDE